jgi:hypothetical protein
MHGTLVDIHQKNTEPTRFNFQFQAESHPTSSAHQEVKNAGRRAKELQYNAYFHGKMHGLILRIWSNLNCVFSHHRPLIRRQQEFSNKEKHNCLEEYKPRKVITL